MAVSPRPHDGPAMGYMISSGNGAVTSMVECTEF